MVYAAVNIHMGAEGWPANRSSLILETKDHKKGKQTAMPVWFHGKRLRANSEMEQGEGGEHKKNKGEKKRFQWTTSDLSKGQTRRRNMEPNGV